MTDLNVELLNSHKRTPKQIIAIIIIIFKYKLLLFDLSLNVLSKRTINIIASKKTNIFIIRTLLSVNICELYLVLLYER
ncbi:hypothetical protein GCM10022323_21700 [Asaccharospora irregularis DSM 2635]